MDFQPLIEVTRGGLVESHHAGAIAVADARGRLRAGYGDPQHVAFLRSTAKPLQVLPLLESGAARAYDLTPREIAVACASHTGSAQHLEAVRNLLAKAGLTEADLGCGAHLPDDAETRAQLLRERTEPTPLYNNCSGKHAGMLALAKFNGWPLTDYLDPQHPVQRLILRAVAEMLGLPEESVMLGVDGCSAPNFAAPLVNAAAAFARLADPRGLPPARAEAVRAAVGAMQLHPELVHGAGKSDTELMRARPGIIIAKRGAEGFQGIGLAPGALGAGSPALGIALKIADGDGAGRAVAAAAVEVLRQLGALDSAQLAQLAERGVHATRPLTNWRGLTVGELRPVFTLKFEPGFDS
ncbi:MAG: asparaginase [Anaerolineales bacterium]|nr:asparaginase [Anaerolineales bacterium]